MSAYSQGSAYGVSSPYTQIQRENLNMELALGANPWLGQDPAALLAIAQSGADPEDVITNASAIAGVQTIDTLAETLKNLTPVAQRAVYGKLSEQQQAALQSIGYEGPQGRDKGFLDDTPFETGWDVAAKVTSVATRPVGIGMRAVGGPALNALNWVGDVPGHFYRSIRQMEGWQQWLSLAAGVGVAVATKGKVTGGLKGAGSLAQIGGVGLTGLGAGVAATAPTALQNPSEWWEVMNPVGRTGVTRGERLFTRDAQRQVRELLNGSSTFETLARDVAAGIDGYDIVAEFAGVRDASSEGVMVASLERVAKQYADPGTVEYQTIYTALTELMELPEFRDAVDILQQSKVSFGRDAAGVIGLQPGDAGYGFVSGSADAFWLVTMDPILGLGKLGKVQRLWRRGLDTPSGPDAIARLVDLQDDPAIAGVFTKVVDAVNRESLRSMPKQWRPLFTDMLEFKRGRVAKGMPDEFDIKEFFEYIRTGDGLAQISRGKGTVKGIESIVISAQNSGKGWSRFVDAMRRTTKGFEDAQLEDDFYKTAAKFGVEDGLNKAAPRDYMNHAIDMKFDYHDFRLSEAVGGELTNTQAYQFGKSLGKVVKVVPGGTTLIDFITGITTMIPAGSALKLTRATTDDFRDIAEDMPRFVEAFGKMTNLPSYVRDEWLDTIMRQPNVAMRRNAALSFLDSTFKATGWHADPALKRIADDIIEKHKQAYTLGGGDNALTPLGERILGSLPELDQAVYIVMPDLREMTKVVRRGFMLKNLAKLVDHNIAEQAMSRVIKPGWLFRIGFIPRAAGEEMLAFWLRMSEGGMVQEFAARSVARRTAHVEARKALHAAGGNLNKLTPDQLFALKHPLPSIVTPVIAMGRRIGWEPPEAGLLSTWADWQAKALKRGFGANDLYDMKRAAPWYDEILLGRDASVRRMIIGGIDPVALKAGDKWLAMHATSIMRAASASVASDFERARMNPPTANVVVDDVINPGKRKNVTVVMRGERGRTTAADPQHKNAVFDGATRWVNDGIMRGAAKTVIPRFRPASVKVDDVFVGDFFEALDSVQTYASKQILAELLSFRDDNWRAAYNNLSSLDPNLKDALRASVHNGRFDLDEFAQSIDGMRAKKVPVFDDDENVIGVQQALSDEDWFKLMKIRDEVAKVQPFLDELAALDVSTRKWMGMKFSEYMASDNPADFARNARALASGGQPKNVLYRGVLPEDIVYNADGSITIKPTTQGQWGGGKRAVSLTTNPEEALIYATQAVTNTAGTERLGTGVVLKFDGDFLAQMNNQTFDQVRKSGRSYQTGDEALVRENGMRYIGHADTEATEIAFITDADEINIPAGKWETLRTEDMQQIVANASDSQWAERIAGIKFDVGGHDIESATIALKQSMEEFSAGLSAPERELLRDAYRERQAAYRTALDAQVADLSTTVPLPDPIFDSLIRSGELDALDQGDEFAEKVQAWVNSEVLPGATVKDVIGAYLTGNEYPYAADDIFQGVIGSDYRFSRVDKDIYGEAEFSSSADAIDAIHRGALQGRGRGAFEDHQTWSPYYTSMDDFREAFINEIVAQLHRPEHQDTLKLAEQALHTPDQAAIVRPPADGTARVYTPVVPPQSQVVDEVLAQWNEALPSGVQTQLDNLESLIFNPNSGVSDEEILPMIDFYLNEATQQALAANDEAAEMIVDELYGGWYDITVEYQDDNGVIQFGEMLEDMDPDEILLAMGERLDALRGPTYEEAARQLIARSNWVNMDDLSDMPEEVRLRIVAEAIKRFKASQGRYQLGMTQALDGMAVDDPRIARYISNLFSSDRLQKPRVGVITVPRTAPNTSGAGLDGLRMKFHDEKYGRVYDVHEMYRDKAVPMDAEAFQRIGYTYTDYRGNTVEAHDLVPGRSIEESVHAYATQIVDNWLSQTRRGVKEAQVYRPKNDRTTRVARRGETGFEPLEPGEVSYSREDLFEIDETGKNIGPVDFGDNRYFDHEIKEQEEDLMWGIIGPAMRDIYEGEAGLLNSVTKSFREESGFMPGALSIEDDLEPNSFVTMTRSRVDDVDDEPSAMLPNVGLTQKYDNLPNTVWDRFIRWGFDTVIGPSIDALARKPMAFHYYVAAYKQQQRQMSWMLNRQIFDDVIPELFPDLFAYFNGGSGGFNDVDLIAFRAAMDGLMPGAVIDDMTDDDMLTFVVNRMRQDRNRLLVDLDNAWERLEVRRWQAAEDAVPGAREQQDRYIELIREEREFMELQIKAGLSPDEIRDPDFDISLTEDQITDADFEAYKRWMDEYPDAEVTRVGEEMWEHAKTNEWAIQQEHVRWLADTVENNPTKLLGQWKLRDLEGRPYSEIFVQDLMDRLPTEAWETHAAFNAALDEEMIPLLTTWDQYSALKNAAENMRHVDAIAEETALYRAVDNVIPFLDSHEQRSLFAEYGRNFLPFWYAEENFIKRWARTFALGEFGIPGRSKLPNWAKHATIPTGGLDALRKAQLTYMGIRSAGVIRTDANGDDWVVYPGSGLLTEAVAKILPGDVQPIGVLFAASTDSMLPGVSPDNTIAPSPFIGMPVTVLAHFFPDAKGVKDAILGPIGSQRGIIDQFVPSVAGNMWEAVFGDEMSSVRYASAMMAAMAYAEAEDRGLPDNATSDQIEEYLDKMRNHARIIMVSQALSGYVVPGAPRPLLTDAEGASWLTGVGVSDPEEITSEMYRDYIKNMGMEEGTAAFLREFPNADLEDVINPLSLTAAGTWSVSGAPLPATQTGMSWYENNADWIDSLPEAGAWFMPQEGSNEFEYTAYRQQLISGLRKRRNPTEFIRSIKFRSASTTYFDVKDEYEKMVAQTNGDQDTKRLLDAQWDRWKTMYLAAHPIFAEELQNGTSRIRRNRQVDQLRYAVQDPQAPESPYKDAIKDMVEIFDIFDGYMTIYRDDGSADAREEMRKLRERFEAFGDAWALENPDLQRLWSSVYRVEAGL